MGLGPVEVYGSMLVMCSVQRYYSYKGMVVSNFQEKNIYVLLE